MMDPVHDFLQSNQQLRGSIRTRITSYFEYMWHMDGGMDNSAAVINRLPPSLMNEVYVLLYEGMITKVPIFANAEWPLVKALC